MLTFGHGAGEEEEGDVMAGKGRGVGAFTFNIDALGIGRGSMPEARVGPTPLFPVSTHTHTLYQHPPPRECYKIIWMFSAVVVQCFI